MKDSQFNFLAALILLTYGKVSSIEHDGFGVIIAVVLSLAFGFKFLYSLCKEEQNGK